MNLLLLCSVFHTVSEVFVVTQICRQFAGLNPMLVGSSGGRLTDVSFCPLT